MQKLRGGWFRKTLATCGDRLGCPSSSALRDWEASPTSAHADATPTRGLGSTDATRPLMRARAARLRGFFVGCTRGPREDRSRAELLTGHKCVKPSGAPHCGSPTRHGCRFGWSVGRCSSRWCAAARGRPPNNGPNRRPCATRPPSWQGWNPWPSSGLQACGMSNAIAMATLRTCGDPGCCRTLSTRLRILATSFQTARPGKRPRATPQARRRSRGNVVAPQGCRCVCGRRPRWRNEPTGWDPRPMRFADLEAAAPMPWHGCVGGGRTPIP